MYIWRLQLLLLECSRAAVSTMTPCRNTLLKVPERSILFSLPGLGIALHLTRVQIIVQKILRLYTEYGMSLCSFISSEIRLINIMGLHVASPMNLLYVTSTSLYLCSGDERHTLLPTIVKTTQHRPKIRPNCLVRTSLPETGNGSRMLQRLRTDTYSAQAS